MGIGQLSQLTSVPERSLQDLTVKDKGLALLRGAKGMFKSLVYENDELSLKKMGLLALNVSLFVVANRTAVITGLVRPATVTRMLTGLGAGYGGYKIYNGVSDLKGAENRNDKLKAWEKIGSGAGTFVLCTLPAKSLAKGLGKIQPVSAQTVRPRLQEVVLKTLDNKSLLETVKDKNALSLFLYGTAFEDMTSSKNRQV